MPRLCVSIPVHEKLPVVFDQLDNIRAFLPDDTLIVLHVSRGFCDAGRLAHIVPDGVYVNPTQLETEWGDVLPQHHSNFRFIRQVESFDYFVIHASNDMFFLPGAAEYIRSADVGVQQHRFGPPDDQTDVVRMAREIGAETVFHSQTEGTWYRTELYAELIEIVEKYWANNGVPIAPEEFFYPTAASTLTKSMALPYVHTDTHWASVTHPVSTAFLHSLHNGSFSQSVGRNIDYLRRIGNFEPNMPSAELDYNHVHAVKRIPRDYWHPFRVVTRTFTRLHQPRRMRLPIRGTEPAAFQIVTFAKDAIEDERLLFGYRCQFSADDDVVLLIWVGESTADIDVPELVQAATAAGLDDENAPRVEAVVLPDGDESTAQMAWVADVFYHPVLTMEMSEMLWVPPTNAAQLRTFYETAIYGRSRNASTSAGVPS